MSSDPAPAATTVTVVDNRELSRFEALDGTGEVAGYAEYRRDDERIVFTHTVVEDAYEGRGIGGALVRGALDEVRRTDLRVLATCPFVKAWITRHPEYGDLTRR